MSTLEMYCRVGVSIWFSGPGVARPFKTITPFPLNRIVAALWEPTEARR